MGENTEVLKKMVTIRSKNWKEYFLEFFMLFLAVTLGFLADNIREKISDNGKEKEYIISMIEDAKTDKLNIERAIQSNNVRVKHLDSLIVLCMDYDSLRDSEMYAHYRYGLIHPDFITPTERTIQQLKNAGGMRLIGKRTAVNKIVQYDTFGEKLANQQGFYEKYQNQSIELATLIFNFNAFNFGGEGIYENVQLIQKDPLKLIEFGNVVVVYTGVAKYYGYILQEMDKEASVLIQTLQEDYDIKETQD